MVIFHSYVSLPEGTVYILGFPFCHEGTPKFYISHLEHFSPETYGFGDPAFSEPPVYIYIYMYIYIYIYVYIYVYIYICIYNTCGNHMQQLFKYN